MTPRRGKLDSLKSDGVSSQFNSSHPGADLPSDLSRRGAAIWASMEPRLPRERPPDPSPLVNFQRAHPNVQPVLVSTLSATTLPIARSWLRWTRSVAQSRTRIALDPLWGVWKLNCLPGFAMPVGAARGDDRIEEPTRVGSLVGRFLLACAAAAHEARHQLVRVDGELLSRLLWGVRRPVNWRATLAATADAAGILQYAYHRDGKWHYTPALGGVRPVGQDWIVLVDGLLGGVLQMANDDGALDIVRRKSQFEDPISRAEIEEFVAASPFVNSADYKVGEVKELIRQQRLLDFGPSMQSLMRKQRLIIVFLPALLGEPAACRRCGPIALLLHRELTRAKPVIDAQAPGWSGPAKIVCPLLDAEKTYAAFAANGGGRSDSEHKRVTNRQGRGYRLATWAERFGGTVSEFLEALATAVEPLGLIPAALDASGTWHTLEELRNDPSLHGQVHLRVYTLHEDWMTRWCKFFAWNQPTESATAADAGELGELRSLIREQGVKVVADGIGVHYSVISKILSGARQPRAELVAKLREYFRGQQPLGGEGKGSVFGDRNNMLDWAMAYRTRLNWSVIPMAPTDSAEKKPAVLWKQWQTELPSESQTRVWWQNRPDAGIAVVLGPVSGIVAIDVDGQEAYEVLIQHLGKEPKAPKAHSGSGDKYRMHFYFRCPAGLKTTSKMTPWHPKLEIRGQGGYIVLPPSPHKSGNKYRWAKGAGIEERELPELPKQIVEALREEAARPASAPTTSAADKSETRFENQRVNASTAKLLRGEFTGAKGQRNSQLYTAARDMAARGWNIERATTALLKGIGIENDAHRRECLRTIKSAFDGHAAGKKKR